MEVGLLFYLLPTVLPFHLSLIGGQKNSDNVPGINVPGLTALFAKPVRRKGLTEEETIECYCEGFIDGHYQAQGSCLEQLFCEKDSWIKCKKSAGCAKSTYKVQGKEFIVKFCGDAKTSDGGVEPKKCKTRKANSSDYGKVELIECLCHGDHCNGSSSLLYNSPTFFINLLICLLTPLLLFISIELGQPG